MHTKRRPNNGMSNGGGNGQHRHNNHNNNRPRRFNNNRPQGSGSENDSANVMRTRRNATQNREKFQMMAHDAMRMGDRVLAENYLQHAEHYYRVLMALPPEEAPRPQYLRGHQPGEAAQQGDGSQQAGQEGQHPQDDGSNNMQDSTHSSALPSFITQQPQDSDQQQRNED